MADNIRHGLADHLETELPKLKTQWEAGSASALIKAFVWCSGNDFPFPTWLTAAVFDELVWCRSNRPRGKTKADGNSAALERNKSTHEIRFRLMEMSLGFQQLEVDAGKRSKLNLSEAAREAGRVMGGKHYAWAEPREIIKSYHRLKGG